MKKNIHISVVIPVYGCVDCLKELSARLHHVLGSISFDYEIILVNDSSPDDAWPTIVYLANENPKLKGINLSRNFGQHSAITAGLHHACGDWVVVMDCDLQDQPEDIALLYKRAQEGFDVVFGQRHQRQDGRLKKLSSKLFYKVYGYFTDTVIDSSVANFSIISNKVVEGYCQFKEQHLVYPLFVRWLGFHSDSIPVSHSKRLSGNSSYTLLKLLSLAGRTIVAQSNKPLRLSIQLGFLMSGISALAGIWFILKYFIHGVPIDGWTSLIVSLYFLTGMILAVLGIHGIYMGKVFDEIKGRPIYVIKDKTDDFNNK